jgi:hypothetical protein
LGNDLAIAGSANSLFVRETFAPDMSAAAGKKMPGLRTPWRNELSLNDRSSGAAQRGGRVSGLG